MEAHIQTIEHLLERQGLPRPEDHDKFRVITQLYADRDLFSYDEVAAIRNWCDSAERTHFERMMTRDLCINWMKLPTALIMRDSAALNWSGKRRGGKKKAPEQLSHILMREFAAQMEVEGGRRVYDFMDERDRVILGYQSVLADDMHEFGTLRRPPSGAPPVRPSATARETLVRAAGRKGLSTNAEARSSTDESNMRQLNAKEFHAQPRNAVLIYSPESACF